MIDDRLVMEHYYLAYGRSKDKEIRIYIKDNSVEKVTVGDVECEMSRTALVNTIPITNVAKWLWKWLHEEYLLRVVEGGLL